MPGTWLKVEKTGSNSSVHWLMAGPNAVWSTLHTSLQFLTSDPHVGIIINLQQISRQNHQDGVKSSLVTGERLKLLGCCSIPGLHHHPLPTTSGFPVCFWLFCMWGLHLYILPAKRLFYMILMESWKEKYRKSAREVERRGETESRQRWWSQAWKAGWESWGCR